LSGEREPCRLFPRTPPFIQRMGLSARAHDRVLKLACTIADLGESENIAGKHLAEAVQ